MVGKSMLSALVGAALATVGCLGTRDVEVSGKVIAPKSVSVGETLVIDFIDHLPAGSAGAHRKTLQGLGEFKERVSLEADIVDVVGLDDRDGDGRCSDGEAWGRVSALVEHDRAEGITLMLLAQPCPATGE
jgi:hypothetical protein